MSVTPDAKVLYDPERSKHRRDEINGASLNLGGHLNDACQPEHARNANDNDNDEENEDDWIDLDDGQQRSPPRRNQRQEDADDDSASSPARENSRAKRARLDDDDNNNDGDDPDVDMEGFPDRKPSPKPEPKAFKTRALHPLKSGDDSTICQIFKNISYGPTVKAFIDSAATQRLHKLKQLGVADTTYKSATHTRFEHSLGVYHVATKLCETLRQNQPYLNITDKDVLCIGLAGLCHDFGHGPFSHIFDGEFMKRIRRDIPQASHKSLLPPEGWTHEDASIMMFNYTLWQFGLAVDKHALDKPMKQIGNGIKNDCFGVYSKSVPLPSHHILTSRDMIFVQECILGEPLKNEGYDTFIGRLPEEKKEFLYDIVSNRHNGLDVDKYDYFMRDASRTVLEELHFDKLLNEAVVARAVCSKPKKCCLDHHHDPSTFAAIGASQMSPQRVGGNGPSDGAREHLMICYPDKLVEEAANFFQTRFTLHSRVYTHKASKGAEYMVSDILAKANQHTKIKFKETKAEYKKRDGRGPRKKFEYDISTAMTSPRAYLMLTDRILDKIEGSSDDELEEAQDLIERLSERDLYKHVSSQDHERESGSADIQQALEGKSESEIKRQLLHLASVIYEKGNTTVKLEASDLLVERWHIHHGMKHENPVMLMRFLKREQMKNINNVTCVKDLPKAEPINPEHFRPYFPQTFEDKSIRLYCTVSEKYDYENAKKKGAFIDILFLQWITNLRAGIRGSTDSGDDGSDGDGGGGGDGRPQQTADFYGGATMLTQEEVPSYDSS
jgi:HD superfamily phosphohydrolase